MITNIGVMIDKDLLVASVQVQATPDDSATLDIAGAQDYTNRELNTANPVHYALRNDAKWRIIGTYTHLEYGALTPLREDLQKLEVLYPGDFLVVGFWDYHTGQPVGGAGSPWFVTPQEFIDLAAPPLPLAAGQHPRVFI